MATYYWRGSFLIQITPDIQLILLTIRPSPISKLTVLVIRKHQDDCV